MFVDKKYFRENISVTNSKIGLGLLFPIPSIFGVDESPSFRSPNFSMGGREAEREGGREVGLRLGASTPLQSAQRRKEGSRRERRKEEKREEELIFPFHFVVLHSMFSVAFEIDLALSVRWAKCQMGGNLLRKSTWVGGAFSHLHTG